MKISVLLLVSFSSIGHSAYAAPSTPAEVAYEAMDQIGKWEQYCNDTLANPTAEVAG